MNNLPSDKTTAIEDLKNLLRSFRDARNWKQFHTPKNLSNAISIEASELMEHFLWKTDADIDELLKDPLVQSEIEEELADILCFCLNLANVLNVDIAQAVTDKIKKNDKKYPVEKAKGQHTKYNKL